MDTLLTYKTAFVISIFIALFVCERMWPSTKAGTKPWLRVFKNIAFWPLNIGASLLVVLPVTFWASQHALWPHSAGMLTLLDILILDGFIYFWHKAVHLYQPLWRFHEIHHLDEHLDTTSAIRFHFGEVLISSIVRAIVIIMCGISFVSVLIFEALVLAFTLFHHSNIKLPAPLERTLSKIFVTPEIHWVHHHAIRADTDSNYGTIFSFWDILFKTRSTTQRTPDMPIGVEGKSDKPLIRLLIKPFKKPYA